MSLPSSFIPLALYPSADTLAAPCASSSLGKAGGGGGAGSVPSHPTADVPGTSGADDFDFADPLGEDPFDREASGSHPLGRATHLQAFQEVISLITVFFPGARPTESCMVDRSSWFEDFGAARQRDPHTFLALFDNLSPVKKEIAEKFAKVADNKRRPLPPCQPGVIYIA